MAGLPVNFLDMVARKELMKLYVQVTQARDELGREILINALLCNYIYHKNYELADKFIEAVFDINRVYRSNNQSARFFYYVAVVKSVKLNYTEAEHCITHALRKAPEKALGFRIIATKLLLIIQLLKGVIPQRSEFFAPGMQIALEPYLALTSCVRFGQINRFHLVTNQYEAVFEKDNTLTLITRIRHNVIKMALCRICHSYARISFSDLTSKLSLENEKDSEYLVAKAIKDGVINAFIDHDQKWVVTRDVADVYSTTEPALALQKRVVFCNITHNEARRAMKYGGLCDDDDEERKKKLEQETKELAKALEDGVDPEGLDDGDF